MNPDLTKAVTGLNDTISQANAKGYSFSPITANSLNPSIPLSLPQTTGSDIPQSISSSTDQQLATYLGQQQQNAQAKETTAQSELDKTFSSILGVQNSQAQAEANAGIPELSKLSNDTFSAIQASKRSQEKELLALDNIPGLTLGQKQQKATEINRRYAFEQADLSISYDVANRNYTNAQATVDRKIQLQLEPLKTLFQYQQGVLERNQSRLDDAQKNQLQSLITQNERAYQTKQTQLTNANAQVLNAAKNGAPPDLITQANSLITQGKTIEAQNLVASYQANPQDQLLKQLQILKAQQDLSGAGKIVKINGVDYIQNPDGTLSNPQLPTQSGSNLQLAKVEGNIQQIDSILNNPYLKTAVGSNVLGRLSFKNPITGGKTSLLADIDQIISQLNLDKLIQSKAEGATFGALSDNELRVLSSAGTKLASLKRAGGFGGSESEFKKELDKVKYFAALDYIRKGGIPENIGAIPQPDGTYWIKNSDDSYTQVQ